MGIKQVLCALSPLHLLCTAFSCRFCW